jgi:glycosyltransferase involved in cell wall biosynthesis
MKVFVLGLPHTQTSPAFCTCAYTMKVWNLCQMMVNRGHEVVHFGNEGSNPVCGENVDIMSRAEFDAVHRHPGTEFYDVSVTTPERIAFHALFAKRMRDEISKRLTSEPDTIICVTWGGPQREAVVPISDRAFVVESGIGYENSWASYRVFESYAWLHMTLGAQKRVHGNDWYWVVIPNAFDTSMFEFRSRKEDYFLYLGRLIESKGVGLAVDIARRTGTRIVLAGQGEPEPWLAPHVEYVGPVGVERRRQLLAGARALFCPTYYIEPFGGVNVEAQLSGTPVIASDHGAFTETVLHGVTGYRCRTAEQFEFAARNIHLLRPEDCRKWAMNFSLERVALMYEEYFQMVLDLSREGFYAARPDRIHLRWLKKEYPGSATNC